ncbi:unannotated protein [freshwater metagenome]|uniref:Unannotated protein n=1 Tax=freshwater metagenome TaxID=449393 RepID=A0A6J7KWQ1_9ZZZZ
MGNVYTEARYTAVKPETQDAVEVFEHLLVVPVEVGLGRIKDVKVPLALCAIWFGNTTPGVAAEDRLPVVWLSFARSALAVAEDVHVTLG